MGQSLTDERVTGDLAQDGNFFAGGQANFFQLLGGHALRGYLNNFYCILLARLLVYTSPDHTAYASAQENQVSRKTNVPGRKNKQKMFPSLQAIPLRHVPSPS